MKIIDLRWNIETLCANYPEVIELLVGLGFVELSNPMMRATIGRVMSIPKGAIMKGIPLEHIKQILVEHGFEVIDSAHNEQER